MKETRRVLVLGFTSEIGKSVNITINDPADGLEGEVIGGVMEEIIASVALGDESLVANKTDAKYVIQQVEEISLNY